MKDVTNFATARASRGVFARFVSHKADAGRIQGFRAQIKDALDRFAVCLQRSTSATKLSALSIPAAVTYHCPRRCVPCSRTASSYSTRSSGICTAEGRQTCPISTKSFDRQRRCFERGTKPYSSFTRSLPTYAHSLHVLRKYHEQRIWDVQLGQRKLCHQ